MFETLPKVRTYAHLGRLAQTAEDECSAYNPTTWGNCIFQTMGQAKRELETIHNQVLQYANAARSALDVAQDSGDSDLISRAQHFVDESASLVYEHTELINAYFSELDRYTWIPGVSTLQSWTGLRGVGQNPKPFLGLGNLGVWQLIAFQVATTIGALARIIVIGYLVKAIGDIAQAFKSHYEASISSFQAYGQYLKAYAEAQQSGGTPPQPPGGGPGSGGIFGLSSTGLVIAGLVALFVFGVNR